MSNPLHSDTFIVTKEHRRFIEFCDACRRYQYIGLCYGAPGVGKTLSARHYACQQQVDCLLAQHRLLEMPFCPDVLQAATLLFTPEVVHSPRQLDSDIQMQRRQLNDIHYWMKAIKEQKDVHTMARAVPDATDLIIIDEADRLKAMGLEQMRDIYDRGNVGLILIGMPGIERRLARYPQLYSRLGFVHHFKSLSEAEVRFVLQHKWQALGLSLDPTDFTDAEAVTAITRVTSGNFRLLQRLMSQVERVLQINELRFITKEVVAAARELLIIGAT